MNDPDRSATGMDRGEARVHVAIPTLSASRAPHIAELCASLQACGASVTIFANGKTAFEELVAASMPVISVGENLGFAAGVNRAVQAGIDGADWVVVMNDDIEATELGAVLGALRGEREGDLVSFGDEPVHRIPRIRDVFFSISMLGGVRRRRRRAQVVGELSTGEYAPFSFVAVRAEVWRALEGLDERFPFSSEDADFVRRAHAHGARSVARPMHGIRHLRGATGRANIDRVLPAAVWGGYQYLRKWEIDGVIAVVICLGALALRVPLVFFSKSARRAHLRGVFRAFSHVLRGRRPDLPSYDDF